jgi:L-threonylcarbamoyladenylate synthase
MILDGTQAAAIATAADTLAAGQLLGLPTETVYGLAARADDDAAVARIFAAKGRPSDHPLIVHVADVASAEAFAHTLPPLARRLMAAFWPGPMTVIVPRRPGVAAAAAGGQTTVGLRCPAHPVAHAVIRAAAARGVHGVAAPSANRFGRVSPTTAAHVASEFGDALLVLDGGACALGIESTIIDCSRGAPVLLRPGVLTVAQIEAVLGERLQARDAAAPRASGTLESHYAPQAKVLLRAAEALAVTAATEASQCFTGAVYSRQPLALPAAWMWRAMPTDAVAVAHELFAVLRELDDQAVSCIVVETPPPDAAWDGVRDRLLRAAAS